MDFSAKGRRDRKSYVQHDLLYNVMEIFFKKGEKKVSCKKGVVLFFFDMQIRFYFLYWKKDRDCNMAN